MRLCEGWTKKEKTIGLDPMRARCQEGRGWPKDPKTKGGDMARRFPIEGHPQKSRYVGVKEYPFCLEKAGGGPIHGKSGVLFLLDGLTAGWNRNRCQLEA